MGADSGGAGDGSWSSRLLGRTIRAKSFIFALRRKTPKGIRGGAGGALGGIIFGVLTRETEGLRMKGDSFSCGSAPVEVGVGWGVEAAGAAAAAGATILTVGASTLGAVGITEEPGRSAMICGFFR